MAIFRLNGVKKLFEGPKGYWWGSLVRLITILVLYGICMTDVHLEDLMSLGGAFCNSYLAILLPNLLYLRWFGKQGKITMSRKIIHYLVIFLG